MFLTERRLFPSLENKLIDICKQLGNSEENIQQLIKYIMSEENEKKDYQNEISLQNLYSSPSLIQCSLFAIYQTLFIFLSEICNFKIRSSQILFFGHSFGELSALCAAGAFNISQGMKLLWRRGELIENGTKPAKMLMMRQNMKQNHNLVALLFLLLMFFSINIK